MDPASAQGAGRMFPGTLGGHSQIASPVDPIRARPQLTRQARIWGLLPENQSVIWWTNRGVTPPAFQSIPDPDAWYIGDLGGVNTSDQLWPGGGSDGTFNYFAVIGDDGQWYVDKFNATITALLDRFPIEGWSSWGIQDASDYYVEQNSEVKHLSARGNRIVVVAQQYDGAATNPEYSVRVAVLDLAGTTLHSHEVLTYPSNTWERLEGASSSCIDVDVTKVYFAIHDWDLGDTFIVNVDLETGVEETMYDLLDVNNAIAAVDSTWFGYDFYPARQNGAHGGVHDAHGLLATPDGDLIISSGTAGDLPSGIMRVQPDGTPVWWRHL